MWYYFFAMLESAAEIKSEKTNLILKLIEWIKQSVSLFKKPDFDARWFQEDPNLSREAADKLEAAVVDPQSGISPDIYKNQEALFAFLEAAERGLKERRLDGLCSKLGVLDMAGFESVAKAEALKIIGNRKTAAAGFVILVADLDGLGRLNDALGHPVGNEFILGAANAVKSSIRATDIVSRFGGGRICGFASG